MPFSSNYYLFTTSSKKILSNGIELRIANTTALFTFLRNQRLYHIYGKSKSIWTQNIQLSLHILQIANSPHMWRTSTIEQAKLVGFGVFPLAICCFRRIRCIENRFSIGRIYISRVSFLPLSLSLSLVFILSFSISASILLMFHTSTVKEVK